MGAHPEDYKRSSPPHSYIHVDDFQSPKELAAYLKVLDANATRYREYFKWKRTGEFINTYFWCRLCAMLHAPKTKSYDDLHSWWAGPGQCYLCQAMKEIKILNVWILFLLECPLNTQGFSNLPHVFNWTATYRHDSDIVAPYEKFVAYPDPPNDNPANSAEQKSKKVAWFVSNCAARNRRLQFARELANHIEVDIYGTCGQKRCPRTQATRCFDMLDRDYKFYLAFENSNCRDYITEKFFVNGLGQDVVPIVMGAHPEDYKRSSPPHSYIHVDDFQSPKELAAYLKVLDANATRYREYFKWKRTGEFINTYFWCRLCAMLHAPKTKSYDDLHSWWAGPGQCTSQHWQNL
ncbi:FUT7 [Cordylochernes scorpioides]|uniref:Fucosyltransferase n=1 Tax=Cordylochernes scorpioides TaxID=51811 RepID=A0ABY6L760_9ARAC|nr:FUT7 [Cordylochernes scorpioides]